jgi:hypothetical protein
MGWATFWAIFSQTHLVTLLRMHNRAYILTHIIVTLKFAASVKNPSHKRDGRVKGVFGSSHRYLRNIERLHLCHGHKGYQIAVNIPQFSVPRPSKMYPSWKFWS